MFILFFTCLGLAGAALATYIIKESEGIKKSNLSSSFSKNCIHCSI